MIIKDHLRTILIFSLSGIYLSKNNVGYNLRTLKKTINLKNPDFKKYILEIYKELKK